MRDCEKSDTFEAPGLQYRQMPGAIQPWLPAIFMVFAIWIGLIYNNKRLDDFNKRLDDFKDLMRSEIARSEERVLAAIAELRHELKADIRRLEQRIERLEASRIIR